MTRHRKVKTMNEKKQLIIEIAVNPVTIQDIHLKTGIKYPNLSKHIKELKERGLLFDVGKKGKFSIVQTNKYKVKELLQSQINEKIDMMEKVI
jgi:predicted transcriptional regulator